MTTSTLPQGQTYTLQVQGTAGHSRWTTQLWALNDEEAVKQAQVVALEFEHVRWFMALIVWPAGKLTDQSKPLASITLDQPKTSVRRPSDSPRR